MGKSKPREMGLADNYLLISEANADELGKCLGRSPQYVTGAILMAVDGVPILDYRHWDLVDQLWSYWINAVHELVIQKVPESRFLFPDQPLEVVMKDLGYGISIKVGDQKPVMLDRKAFLSAMVDAASAFLQAVIGRIPDLQFAVNELDEILKAI